MLGTDNECPFCEIPCNMPHCPYTKQGESDVTINYSPLCYLLRHTVINGISACEDREQYESKCSVKNK